MSALWCWVGWHRWRVARVQSLRFGHIVTDRCRRCAAERQRAVTSTGRAA